MTKKNVNVRNTVFVIGAGASKEANLPTGHELKEKIKPLLNIRSGFNGDPNISDDVIREALLIFVRGTNGRKGDMNQYLNATRHIIDVLPLAISIDNFIDANRDNDRICLCGKLAIVRSILDAEKKSLLHFEKSNIYNNIHFPNLGKTWYNRFFQLLTENCGKNDLKERFKSVTLIIFNYDRCTEHFIYCALQKYYRISEAEATEFVKTINIYHPYGDVGTLPWLTGIDQNIVMEFGEEPQPKQLLELSERIKTFTEGTNQQSSEISEIRRHMGTANRVVFLGFAFHPMNMKIITPKHIDDTKQVKCFTTTYGISDSDKEVIEEQIKKLFRGKISVSMVGKSCFEFFGEYRRSLSLC